LATSDVVGDEDNDADDADVHGKEEALQADAGLTQT
jgi:hypothetical protein